MDLSKRIDWRVACRHPPTTRRTRTTSVNHHLGFPPFPRPLVLGLEPHPRPASAGLQVEKLKLGSSRSVWDFIMAQLNPVLLYVQPGGRANSWELSAHVPPEVEETWRHSALDTTNAPLRRRLASIGRGSGKWWQPLLSGPEFPAQIIPLTPWEQNRPVPGEQCLRAGWNPPYLDQHGDHGRGQNAILLLSLCSERAELVLPVLLSTCI